MEIKLAIFVRNTEGKRKIGRCSGRVESNTETDMKERV
jgi:hypothetical protein